MSRPRNPSNWFNWVKVLVQIIPGDNIPPEVYKFFDLDNIILYLCNLSLVNNYKPDQGSALEVTGPGRKTLCLVQCLAMQCSRALTRVKQLSTVATSLAPKLPMRSYVVQSLIIHQCYPSC